MKTRLRILTVLVLLGVAAQFANAQQTPVFSQYYFNELVINPAYAGAHVQLSLTGMYRNQWVNFPGAPRTFAFSGHTSLVNGKVGVGLLVNQDKIGSYNNQNVFLYYSYRLHFAASTLSMGLQGGFNFLGADYSKLDLVNQSDASFQSLNTYKPNIGVGFYYTRKNFFAGFSVPYLLTNYTSLQDAAAKVGEKRYYFIRGGIILPTKSVAVKLNPSILIRAQEGQPMSMDLNVGVILHDIVNAGISWRSGDALITFADIKISEKFHFAYSYDWTSSDISRFSNGTHEFMINYRSKVTQAHKNLACPDFYEYYAVKAISLKGSQKYNPSKKQSNPRKKRKR